MQLVRPGVGMFDPIKTKPIGPAEVMEKFGVPPDKVVEVQALAGDSVDNVPGVPGIGVKTAAQLIAECGDWRPARPRRRDQAAQAPRNADRASPRRPESPASWCAAATTCRCRCRSKTSPAAGRPRRADRLPATQEFRTLAHRVWRRAGRPASASRGSAAAVGRPVAAGDRRSASRAGRTSCVTTMEALARWIARGTAAGAVAFDTETDALDRAAAARAGRPVARHPRRAAACYVP